MKEASPLKMNELPLGKNPAPLSFPHFPSLFHAVVFRNWGQITAAKLARVLGTDEATVFLEAGQMGLERSATPDEEELWIQRGYLTLIRQNWHLLPYGQLLDLLGWTPGRMAYMLKEEDFLWNKLGKLKPNCEPVRYGPPDTVDSAKTDWIKRTLAPWMASTQELLRNEKPFDFVKTFQVPSEAPHTSPSGHARQPTIAYSFFAVYGDPLLDASLDPYPDRLLEQYARNGVNGVWLQGILYTLVPWLGPTPFSEGCETRIENLNRLVERAAKFGIGVYLYLNEPRNMPDAFFKEHPDWQGRKMPGVGMSHLCLSVPEVRERLVQGAHDLAVQVPGLAGAFTITMSENPTHCKSTPEVGGNEQCPHCADRSPQDLVVDANNAIAKGLHEGNPAIRMVAWNWSWDPEWNPEFIARLDSRIVLMCASEQYVVTKAGGVEGLVGDYSMSKIGPGSAALKHWAAAREHGREIWAKVQINNTWECSAVPYLPVPWLVQEHLGRIRKEGVSGYLVSWTLGGFPDGNMPLLDKNPESLAEERFGSGLAREILQGWRLLGEAFREFPLHGCGTLYTGPQNYGPMNLLFPKPTGYSATMVGFPYDDLHAWRSGGHYPEDVFEGQFRILSEGWREGLAVLERAREALSGEPHPQLDDLICVASATWCHFRSVYLQTRFVRLRESVQDGAKQELAKILQEEADLAGRLLILSTTDSRLGFEASNHYYYHRQSLFEKILNCEQLLRTLADRWSGGLIDPVSQETGGEEG